MPQKISDFLPVITTSTTSLYQQTLPWFDEFLKSTKQTVHAPEVGIELLYFDWLRTAYAYRRMLIQDLCLVAFDIAEVRACIMVRRNEVFRKGFDEWEPRFVVKCVNCGKEFQTTVEHCDECFATEVQFQGYEDEIKTNEDGSQEIIKNPIYKTVYSRDENGGKISSKVRSPDLSQVHRFESFKRIANNAGQSLEDVLRQAMEFCYITDDGYILRSKEYYFEDNRLSGSKISEVRALHPALVEFDLDKNGLFKKSHWICLEHRDTVRDAEGPCLECGKQTYPVMYVYNHRGKKVYLTEEEVIHYSVASPSVVYGYSLILSILQKALTLSGMDRFLYRYYFERKTPSGIILTYTDDPQSLEVARSRIEAKMAEDPTYIPWVGVSQKTGRGRCVTGDSLIWTSDGLLTMEELYNGKHTSVETKIGMQKVLDKITFEQKPIIKTILGQNITLRSTYNHPFFTKRGWISAEKLTNRDYVLTAFGRNSFPTESPFLPPTPIKDNCHQKEFIGCSRLTNNLSRLIGYYIAEGHISNDGKYIVISIGKNKSQIDDIIRLCADFDIIPHYYEKDNGFHISCELFTTWFRNIIGWKYNGAYLKEIPLIIRQGTKEQILEFLTGYFGDGFIMKYLLKDSSNYKPIIGWDSVSETLLKQVQQLLFNLGVKARLASKKYLSKYHHDGSYNTNPFKYELLVEGLAAAKLSKLLKDRMVIYKDRWEWAGSYIPTQNRKGKAIFSSTIYKEDTFGTWLKVKQIKPDGIEDVYDLTVKNTHSYVVNGLIVHNTDFVRLFHALQEMDYIPVRAEIRERIAMMFGVPPLWQSDTSGMGGLGSQNRQLEMFSRVVESDQRLLNEKVIPLLLADFGITDWKIRVKTPEEKTEEARLSLASQRIQAANVLFMMGFDIELAENKGAKIDDVNFTISGRAKRPEIPMLGMGGGNGMLQPGQPTIPLQEGEGETEPVAPAGQEVAEDVKNLMNKVTHKHLPFGTRFDRAHGLHNATDKHENNPKDRFNELQKEFDKYSAEVNPDDKRSLSEQEEESSDIETSI